ARTLVALGFAALVLAVAFCVAMVLIALPVYSALRWSANEQLWASHARWPCVCAILWLALLGVYRFGPSRAPPRWSWVSWGAMIAVALWMAGSLVLASVVGSSTLYLRMYGAVGTVLLVLAWFLLTAYVVLLGAEINGELERQTRRDTTAGPAKPLGRRGARAADTVGGSAPQAPRAGGERRAPTHRSSAAARPE
ncbi:MAG: YihY/virulence factor BrkB family protein, partial [Rhizobacter sp.]|nr:YihY/virulence factor BrkB family protein [Rhizobacter sp.]